MHLGQRMQLCEGFLPVNLATAANPGDWVSMKNYDTIHIIYFGGPGAAGEPATITTLQASAVAGTGSKALNFTRYYKKQAATNLQGTGTFTEVVGAAGNTIALGSGADGDKAALVVVTFRAEDLDTEGGFDCVSASVGDPGTTAQLGALLYLLEGARFAPPPSAIVD